MFASLLSLQPQVQSHILTHSLVKVFSSLSSLQLQVHSHILTNSSSKMFASLSNLQLHLYICTPTQSHILTHS